ncbi:IS630 family transposase [Schlesneria sp. DSM 10557]|uniref:IS630 family transposase n=1 Tax=Schlesneria sp. DSM 10557 TaxID=3044399 RepID=UPI00359F4A25
MEGIIQSPSRHDKRRILKNMRRCRNGQLKIRYQIVLNLLEGDSVAKIARMLRVAESTVRRVRERFLAAGEAGLVDRREENGDRKLDEEYLGRLYEVVASSPEEFGWTRPTWTREMLVKVLKRETGIRIHVATMSRALKMIGARRGRPKATVGCPWSEPAKRRKLRQIQRLIARLPQDEVLVYVDEVDIHLNPKIGLDWMVRGQQKQVSTPGKNVKRYLAGALDSRTGELTWVEGERKTSLLFILLLWKLVTSYPGAKRIHVILDNYSIHSTEQVRLSLATEQGQRLQLHFLPPYCPDDNKIERVWQDLHANVTRNHTRPTMPELMSNVRRYLRKRNHDKHKQLLS